MKSMDNNAARSAITDRHPSIHKSGSVVGMKKLGYWGKSDVCVRIGDYIYNLSITLADESSGKLARIRTEVLDK